MARQRNYRRMHAEALFSLSPPAGRGSTANQRLQRVSHPCLGAGDDLHRDTEYPAGEDHPGPGDVRLLAQDDDADGGKRGERRKEGAERGQQFRRIDFGIVVTMKHELRRVDAEIEADRADDHHGKQEGLRGQRADRGADMGGDEQTAGGAGHREAEAFQHMGGFSETETHGGHHRSRRQGAYPFCRTAV